MVKQFTVVDTFSGGGGSSLGWKLAGFKELLAVEFDPDAITTFRMNFPEVNLYAGDIAKLSGDEALRIAGLKPGELDVFSGSPPCQSYSTAGKRQLNDPRGQLFLEYSRLLSTFKPKVFVFENVTGMVKGHMKQEYLKVINHLRKCGYKAKGQVMNAKFYHVPQSRERVIIIGVRDDLGIIPQRYPVGSPHHCTLQFGVDRENWIDWLGTEFQATTLYEAWNGNIQAVAIQLPDYVPCQNVHPHISVSWCKGIKPYESNLMLSSRFEYKLLNQSLQMKVEFSEWS